MTTMNEHMQAQHAIPALGATDGHCEDAAPCAGGVGMLGAGGASRRPLDAGGASSPLLVVVVVPVVGFFLAALKKLQ